MNELKNLGKGFLFFVGATILTIFLLNTLYYFNILSDSILIVLSFFIPLFSLFLISFWLGKKASKRGYLEGLKLGGSAIFFYFLLFVLGFNGTLSIKLLLFYFIFILTSILGSMIGINKKE